MNTAIRGKNQSRKLEKHPSSIGFITKIKLYDFVKLKNYIYSEMYFWIRLKYNQKQRIWQSEECANKGEPKKMPEQFWALNNKKLNKISTKIQRNRRTWRLTKNYMPRTRLTPVNFFGPLSNSSYNEFQKNCC